MSKIGEPYLASARITKAKYEIVNLAVSKSTRSKLKELVAFENKDRPRGQKISMKDYLDDLLTVELDKIKKG